MQCKNNPLAKYCHKESIAVEYCSLTWVSVLASILSFVFYFYIITAYFHNYPLCILKSDFTWLLSIGTCFKKNFFEHQIYNARPQYFENRTQLLNYKSYFLMEEVTKYKIWILHVTVLSHAIIIWNSLSGLYIYIHLVSSKWTWLIYYLRFKNWNPCSKCWCVLWFNRNWCSNELCGIFASPQVKCSYYFDLHMRSLMWFIGYNLVTLCRRATNRNSWKEM